MKHLPPQRVCWAPTEWQREARRYVEAQQWDRAMEIVGRVLAQTPQDSEARAWRAQLLLWSGHKVDAEKEFRELTKAEPTNPDFFLGLASALEHEGRWEEPIATLDRTTGGT